jgi:hypothetical protein
MKNFDKTEKNDEVLIRLGRKLFDFGENKKIAVCASQRTAIHL